jgi:hypothetical protein
MSLSLSLFLSLSLTALVLCVPVCVCVVAEQKKVPSVLYGFDANGKDDRVLLWLDEVLLAREIRVRGAAFMNTLYTLVVDGEKTSAMVLPRDLVLHPSASPSQYSTASHHIFHLCETITMAVAVPRFVASCCTSARGHRCRHHATSTM